MKNLLNSPPTSIAVDTCVLIDLDELNCLHLLSQIIPSVTISKITHDNEVNDELKAKLNPYPIKLVNITTETGYQLYQQLINDPRYKKLSMYDAFAIAIAKEQGIYCGSNEKLIRKACDEFGILYLGTLEILGLAYQFKRISQEELEHYLSLLESGTTSCYITKDVIDEFRKEIL